MALTSIQARTEQLIDMNKFNPFWVVHPTFKHISKLLFETEYHALALEHDVCRCSIDGRCRHRERISGLCHRPSAFQGAEIVGVTIFMAYLVPPSILFIPLASVIQAYGLFDSPFALILVYPTLFDSVLDVASHGILQDHPISNWKSAH